MSKQPQYFYTSDTHVGHRFAAGDRGFWDEDNVIDGPDGPECLADTQSHDAQLADMWDSTVRPQDTVFVLGDISINGSDYALQWHDERPGNKVLITGNHDPVWGFHRDSFKVYQKWNQVFMATMPFLRRKLGGHYFLMSHFPYLGTGQEGHGLKIPRAPEFRLPDMGIPLLHGHTHGKERYHVSDLGTPQLHVGLDAWDMQLVEQDTVQGWLEHPTSTFYLGESE